MLVIMKIFSHINNNDDIKLIMGKTCISNYYLSFFRFQFSAMIIWINIVTCIRDCLKKTF